MGSSVIVKCDKCEYCKEFFVGNGMYGAPFSYAHRTKELIVNEMVLPEHQKTILEFLDIADVVGPLVASYKLYVCGDCNHIEDNYYYEVIMDDIELIPTYSCKKCGKEMNIVKSSEAVEPTSWCTKLLSDCSICRCNIECSHYIAHIILNCPMCGCRSVTLKMGTWDWD